MENMTAMSAPKEYPEFTGTVEDFYISFYASMKEAFSLALIEAGPVQKLAIAALTSAQEKCMMAPSPEVLFLVTDIRDKLEEREQVGAIRTQEALSLSQEILDEDNLTPKTMGMSIGKIKSDNYNTRISLIALVQTISDLTPSKNVELREAAELLLAHLAGPVRTERTRQSEALRQSEQVAFVKHLIDLKSRLDESQALHALAKKTLALTEKATNEADLFTMMAMAFKLDNGILDDFIKKQDVLNAVKNYQSIFQEYRDPKKVESVIEKWKFANDGLKEVLLPWTKTMYEVLPVKHVKLRGGFGKIHYKLSAPLPPSEQSDNILATLDLG